jgi:hypothetical protein
MFIMMLGRHCDFFEIFGRWDHVQKNYQKSCCTVLLSRKTQKRNKSKTNIHNIQQNMIHDSKTI